MDAIKAGKELLKELTTTTKKCKGVCGGKPVRGNRSNAKWCSDTCRKETLYGTLCTNCGEKRYVGEPSKYKNGIPPLCKKCTNRAVPVILPPSLGRKRGLSMTGAVIMDNLYY